MLTKAKLLELLKDVPDSAEIFGSYRYDGDELQSESDPEILMTDTVNMNDYRTTISWYGSPDPKTVTGIWIK